MARSLNRYVCFFLFALGFSCGYAQEEKDYDKFEDKKIAEKDYHDKDSFKKFNSRSQQISAWQIQNLKFGALVVRLQNNQRKVDAFRKVGNEEKALETIARTQYLNKVLMKAYLKEYHFSKVYFIYAQSSDSLINGKRQGIFIDTTLKINPSIVMNENFYLIAETDYVYNSSIGFVKEDSARFAIENGPQTVHAPIVLKNKYGHQLKDPFPFYTMKVNSMRPMVFNVIWKVELSEGAYKDVKLELNKDYAQKTWDYYVENINEKIHHFYEKNSGFQVKDPNLKPFLY